MTLRRTQSVQDDQDNRHQIYPTTAWHSTNKLLRTSIASRQMLFALVGVSVMLLGLILLFVLVEIVGLTSNTAKIVELAVSVQLNYLGNRHLTWRDRAGSRGFGSLVRFNLSRLVTVALSWVIFAVLTQNLGVPYMAASAVSVVGAMIANYLIASFWVFPADGNIPGQRMFKQIWRFAKWSVPPMAITAAWLLLGPATLYYATILLFVFVMFGMAASSLAFKLYTWQTPANLEAVGFDTPKPPKNSFSLIYPVRGEIHDVIRTSIVSLVTQDHPDFEVVMVVSGDDDEDTRLSVEKVHHEFPDLTKVVYVSGTPKNKPLALVEAYKHCSKDIVGVFDAESLAAPKLLINIDTKFQDTGADVVQGGVQLMNYRDSWTTLLNGQEYYWWFKSRLHFHTAQNFITLGGNTVFMKRSALDAVDGWDTKNLTEDADLGVRMSVIGLKIVVAYDPKLATREESPVSMQVLRKQRTRWMQGFLQTYIKGDWRNLPTLRQRLLARYTLTMPFLQAIAGVLLPLSAITAIWLKLPVLIALATFLPLIPALTAITVDTVALREFGVDFGLKIRKRDYAKLILGSIPYQFILSAAAIQAVDRQARGVNTWYKTAHTGLHHTTSDSTVPKGSQNDSHPDTHTSS